jgi:hypothetical protein
MTGTIQGPQSFIVREECEKAAGFRRVLGAHQVSSSFETDKSEFGSVAVKIPSVFGPVGSNGSTKRPHIRN